MVLASLTLHKAIQAVWEDQIDTIFRSYWTAADREEFETLHDQEAATNQPWPYCVLNVEKLAIGTRMNGKPTAVKRYIEDVPVSFTVHARRIAGNTTQSAKQIAGVLSEEVLKRFGGHPETSPEPLSLDYGYVLIGQYLGDFGRRTGRDEYSWVIQYNFRIDMPVAV